eukprot:366112-Chlamydomonas_euryale.AAC.23
MDPRSQLRLRAEGTDPAAGAAHCHRGYAWTRLPTCSNMTPSAPTRQRRCVRARQLLAAIQ